MIFQKDQYNKYRFNPFNLPEKEVDNKHRIKFERISTSVKAKPIWWLLLVFILVVLLYWYLNSRVH
jgi:hypothetical protein